MPTTEEYRQYMLQAREQYMAGRAGTLEELREIYRRAAAAVREDIKNLAPTTGPLRRGHMAALASNLEKRAAQLTGDVLKATHKGIWLSSTAGAAGPAQVAAITLSGSFPPAQVARLFAGINERATLAVLARTTGKPGLMLSDRIWKVGQGYRGSINRLIEDAVARGLDSRKLARELDRYLQPDVWRAQKYETAKRLGVSRDVSYQSMRLARTELNNAFHEGQIAANRYVPGYLGIFWFLSPNHLIEDVCDSMAQDQSHGGEPGFYPKGYEPTIPHPNCLCSALSTYEDPDKFVDRLNAWQRNPGSQPDIEEWYRSTSTSFGGYLSRPSPLSSGRLISAAVASALVIKELADLVNKKI